MTTDVSEKVFEEAIEQLLLRHGPDDPAAPAGQTREPGPSWGQDLPGGYHRRSSAEYDRSLCLLPRDVLDFVLATQPKEWERLRQHHGTEVKERFLRRVALEIVNRGTLDVLRNGIKDSGIKIALAHFRPSSGLNVELQRMHAANFFAVVRQLAYSEKNEKTLDLALFLNGIPVFTAELKNPLTGQSVEDAIRQYKTDRDPREPLLGHRRCLAHFAVDTELLYVTTRLEGASTVFLPFNKGKFGGAGNPPIPPTQGGYATAYLWEETWTRDSVLDLIRRFVHEVELPGENAQRGPRRGLVFPRYQQLDAVRKLVANARANGPGKRYLIQHSAGSGKTFTIAWLAHQLATLHDSQDERVFDSIVVVTDRRILDRQLQEAMRQFEQTLGVVENIDTTSRQLKDALESGKTIIVTTLQKFPVIMGEIGRLAGQRFAVIVDEAHSSQSGEASRSLKAVLSVGTLEDAAREEEAASTAEEETDDRVLAEIEKRGPLSNLSMFAFTATPKSKTLELFGERQADGSFKPFHVYTMRQAIEEGFILDVLENYTTYKAYWRLLKTVKDDPRYDRDKAAYLLKSFVELHPHAIREKVAIMVEHFTSQAQGQIDGQAKAMIVTRSRLHAVRYKLALDAYLKEKGFPFEALVAFSGSVEDGSRSYTESGMNSEGRGRTVSETQTAKEFALPQYRFLICANKFQTGFDQPLLHTMYVDKRLGGVNAVQTLSRLNRTHPGKHGTMVLDFANEADDIREGFEPYFETTLLSEATDPNLLYTIQSRLLDFGVFTNQEVGHFASLYFDRKTTQDWLYAALDPIKERFKGMTREVQVDFRGQLVDFIRLYAFLSQILTFTDVDLEKLYVFGRHLRRLLPIERDELPREVQRNIDMESYRIQQTGTGRIALARKGERLEPQRIVDIYIPRPEDFEPLSVIIAELNERFGLELGDQHRVTLGQLLASLDEDPALDASARVNTRENLRLAFEQKVEDAIQGIVESNFDLYKRITDDPAFGEAIKSLLFDQYLRSHRQAEELLKLPESTTLEFKSSLRWNLLEGRMDERVVTHAVLKTIAAFLNTQGGDLLIGVDDDRTVLGIEQDQLESDDRFMRHLAQVVRNALGDRAGTCINPSTQIVQGNTVCLVSCQRSPEPVFLKWKGKEAHPEGDFFVRSGPRTDRLDPESATQYIKTRFPRTKRTATSE
jgi:type I restriction enzyme R subunit